MAGLIPGSTGGYTPTLLDQMAFSIGRVTNGETITLPQNRQLLSGPITVEDGSIEFREGSEIHFIQ